MVNEKTLVNGVPVDEPLGHEIALPSGRKARLRARYASRPRLTTARSALEARGGYGTVATPRASSQAPDARAPR